MITVKFLDFNYTFYEKKFFSQAKNIYRSSLSFTVSLEILDHRSFNRDKLKKHDRNFVTVV